VTSGEDGFLKEREYAAFLAKLLDLSGIGSPQLGARIADRLVVDILIEQPQPKIIEVKMATPYTYTRIEDVINQLSRYGSAYETKTGKYPTLALAVPNVLTVKQLDILSNVNIQVYDKNWVLAQSARIGLLEEATSLLGAELVAPVTEETSSSLEGELKSVPSGKGYWSLYQKVCGDILDYLFSPPLQSSLREHRNSSGVNRRDIIMPNYATAGFWHFARMTYQADYIVFDAKNFTGNVGKSEVLQLANYLSSHGTGLFGALVTREGENEAAHYVRREQWIVHRKMILIINDDDIIQMMAIKDGGDSPDALIRQKVEDFRLEI
jgi:hypothetical protein